MSITVIQHLVSYLKEIQDIGLFSIMANADLFAAFTGTPLFYIMLPLISAMLVAQAVINGYKLIKAPNRNFDLWSRFIVSVVCAGLGCTSLLGSVIATSLGVVFAAGPWFFFSSVALALTHQCIQFAINCRRAYESNPGTIQRMHYAQAALNNLYFMGLLTAVLGAIIFVLLAPVVPVIATVFASSVVVFTICNMLWRTFPHHWKLVIKSQLHLGKPEARAQLSDSEIQLNPNLVENKYIAHKRLFSHCDYSVPIHSGSLQDSERYLFNLLENKLRLISPKAKFNDRVMVQKVAVLEHLKTAVESGQPIDKKQLVKTHPLAFRSVFAEQSDIGQLADAVLVYFEKRDKQQEQGYEPITSTMSQ